VFEKIKISRIGRPKIAASKRQSRVIAVRVTPDEYRKLDQAAGKLKIGDYIRQKLGLRGDK
jgi:hypothetical protein